MNIYSKFVKKARSFIPKDRIYCDQLKRFAWGTDAGFYRMTPRVVVRAKDEAEVSRLMTIARELKLPVTFRAAGTSLSGQSVSDSILIIAGKNWERYSISEDHRAITLQPGIIGARVNAILKPLGKRFAPDPASIGSAMVGGIVINNSSGMSCGTHANADKELISARLVLPDGTILNTGDKSSREEFSRTHKEFLDEICAIRDEIAADASLAERIRYKYSIKNVTGLNIRPFVAFTDPFDIIAHLMVGSEGTLAFLSEVTMKTEDIDPFSASAMIYFRDIKDAARAVVAMKKEKVIAAELLDSRSLASVHDTTGEGLTAVLTQTTAATGKELDANIRGICNALKGFDTVTGINFTSDPAKCAGYWAIRSGIFPTVGGMRAQGTTCLIEDVAFHIEDLPEATADLSDLLTRHGYDDSCIYGHALEGNFHFILNQAFDSDEAVDRYKSMIEDVVKMVVEKYDGSLKAEHGTGRNMAPFVSYEWGEKAFGIMQRVKRLFDPEGLLNPGVIFNDDPQCYLRDFKRIPVLRPGDGASAETVQAFEKINKCIECGFCEVNCLSCGFTLSSRTRIVLQREIMRRKISSEPWRELQRAYRYQGEKTCAGDGLCSMSCPMGINCADLTHEIRRQSGQMRCLFALVARHFKAFKNAVRGILRLASAGRAVLGKRAMGAICRLLHKIGIPLWTPSTPKAYRLKGGSDAASQNELKVVYIPSCINQMMGVSEGSPAHKPLVEETLELLHKAGYEVIFPKNREALCCGTIWESKGMPDVADAKTREMEAALWEASCQGRYPVLCDQSPCLHRLRTHISSMHLYEPAEFIWKFLKDRLEWRRTDTPVAIHQTCTMRLMGLGDTLFQLASLCSSNVLVPEGVGCCGFAGDKGMTNPELNAWALRKLRAEVGKAGVKIGYSNSRTCEIGLMTNSGIPYISIVYLVNSCTTAKADASEKQYERSKNHRNQEEHLCGQ